MSIHHLIFQLKYVLSISMINFLSTDTTDIDIYMLHVTVLLYYAIGNYYVRYLTLYFIIYMGGY